LLRQGFEFKVNATFLLFTGVYRGSVDRGRNEGRKAEQPTNSSSKASFFQFFGMKMLEARKYFCESDLWELQKKAKLCDKEAYR
jgi:hypothetical protein